MNGRAYAMTVAALIATMCICQRAVAFGQGETQTWRCEIDLHQGHTGRLEFTLADRTLTGTLTVERVDTPARSKVSGTWTGETITFTRTLTPATTIQSFRGVALESAGETVNMAGRFAAGFQGVWSATCKRDPVSTPTLAGGGAGGLAGPALTVRPNPFKPTSKDRVRFIADASHSSGVRDVTIHVDGKAVHTCATAHCEYEAGPFPAGTIRWRVSARAQNGGLNEGREHSLVIAAATATGNCSISGRVTGTRASVAKAFSVVLFGPDNPKLARSTVSLGTREFRFSGLPDGRYRLIPNTKADVDVRINPAQHEVVCQGAAIANKNFDFQ